MLRPSAVDADPDFQDLMRELVTGTSIQAADQLDSAAVHLTPNTGSGAERSPALTPAPSPCLLELFARRVQPESSVLQAPAYGPEFHSASQVEELYKVPGNEAKTQGCVT